jgi:fumarylacetoacetase
VLGARDGQIWPHWMHLPIGYNSRASSVVVSGTPVKRPWGQWRAAGAEVPQHLPTRKLDFELEAALVIGQGNELGEPVRVEDADACGFGVVLLNDWSTRDIQAWESQPLGPFVSKSHRTSISPWVVTLDALEPFRVQGPDQVPPPLAYLRNAGRRSYDIELRASIRPEGADAASVVCRTNMKALYWSFAQQVAHQTSAGCNLQAGDLLGTGTVSGRGAGSLGCLYEATRDGRESIVLEHGGTRTYLEDGDEVIFSGWAQGHGYRVGFGECHGQVVAADRAFGVKS